MSRGEEGIKKIANVTSGKVEQCSARPATPLVAHTKDAKKCRNVQWTAPSKEVDMGDVTREERVELCSARTAIPSPETTLDQSTSDTHLPAEQLYGGNNEDQYVAQGDVVSAAKDNISRGDREGAINGEKKVEVCSAPPALPSLGIPMETEELHVPGGRERTQDDNASPQVKGDDIPWFLSYTEVKRLKRKKRESRKALAARKERQKKRAQDPEFTHAKENPASTESNTQTEISTEQPDVSNISHGSMSAEATMEVTKEYPASVNSDTVPTGSPRAKEQVNATEAPPTAQEMPTSTPPAQSGTLKNKHSGNTDDPQDTVMDTTTGNRKRNKDEEKNSIRELLLFIQTHSRGESRPLSRDQVNLVNWEIGSKNLRMPEITSVSAPPWISRRAPPKTTKDNTRERATITTRRPSSSPVGELSAAELSRISDEKCRQELREERQQRQKKKAPPKPAYIGFKPPRDMGGYRMPDAPMSLPPTEHFGLIGTLPITGLRVTSRMLEGLHLADEEGYGYHPCEPRVASKAKILSGPMLKYLHGRSLMGDAVPNLSMATLRLPRRPPRMDPNEWERIRDAHYQRYCLQTLRREEEEDRLQAAIRKERGVEWEREYQHLTEAQLYNADHPVSANISRSDSPTPAFTKKFTQYGGSSKTNVPEGEAIEDVTQARRMEDYYELREAGKIRVRPHPMTALPPFTQADLEKAGITETYLRDLLRNPRQAAHTQTGSVTPVLRRPHNNKSVSEAQHENEEMPGTSDQYGSKNLIGQTEEDTPSQEYQDSMDHVEDDGINIAWDIIEPSDNVARAWPEETEEQVVDTPPDHKSPEICDTMQDSDQETQEIEEDEESEDDEYHFKRAATVEYPERIVSIKKLVIERIVNEYRNTVIIKKEYLRQLKAEGASKSKMKEAGRSVEAQERRKKNRKAYNDARFARRQKRKKEEEGRHLDATKSKDPHTACHPAQAFTGKDNSGNIKGDGPGSDRSSGNKSTRKRVATTCIESTATDDILPSQEQTGNEDFKMDETLDHEETGTQLMTLTIVDETTSPADNLVSTPELDPTSATEQVRQSTRRRLEQDGRPTQYR